MCCVDGAEEGAWSANWDNWGRAWCEGVGSQIDYQGLPLVVDIRYGSCVPGDVASRGASHRGVERSNHFVI